MGIATAESGSERYRRLATMAAEVVDMDAHGEDEEERRAWEEDAAMLAAARSGVVVLDDGSRIEVGRIKAGPAMEALCDMMDVLPYARAVWDSFQARRSETDRESEQATVEGLGMILIETIMEHAKDARETLRALRRCLDTLLAMPKGWSDARSFPELARVMDALALSGGWRELSPFFKRWTDRLMKQPEGKRGGNG